MGLAFDQNRGHLFGVPNRTRYALSKTFPRVAKIKPALPIDVIELSKPLPGYPIEDMPTGCQNQPRMPNRSHVFGF